MSEPTQLTVTDETLKVMVAQYGVRGTARVLGMDQRRTGAFRRRVSRAKWLHDPALSAAMKKNSAGLSPVAIAKPIVATVSPQQAIAQEISDLGSKSRLGLARGVAKAAAHVETMKGSEVLENAQTVKATAQTANILHGWSEQPPAVRLRLDIAAFPLAPELLTIEAETVVDGECLKDEGEDL